MKVIDLTASRLERLEKGQRETNDTLGRVAQILEAHSRHFERMEEALIGMSEGMDSGFSNLSQRLDRLTAAIARAPTPQTSRY